MRDSYMALGVTLSGNALVIRPIIPHGRNGFAHHFAPNDMQSLGFEKTARLLGEMLVHALGAYQPELDRHPPLCIDRTVQLPAEPPMHLPDGRLKPIETMIDEGERWMQAMVAVVLRPNEIPQEDVPFPSSPTLIHSRGEMRSERLGLGVAWNATGAALRVRTYNGDATNGDVDIWSLKNLAALGPVAAHFLVGERMLRQLAIMHPDVLPSLFPDTLSSPEYGKNV